MPIPGGTTLKLLKDFCAHFKKEYRSLIAFVFFIHISLIRILRSKIIYLNRMVYYQVNRN